MSIASMAHILQSGIGAAAPNNANSIDALVIRQIDIITREGRNTPKSASLATSTTPSVPLTQAPPTSVIPDAPAPATPTTLAPESPKLAPIASFPHLPQSRSNTITTGIGDYLVALAGISGRLTATLVSGNHVDSAVLEAHEHTRRANRFSDMTTVVAMDLELEKLRQIQQLFEKLSRDVREAWHPHTLPNSPEPVVQQSPFPSSRERFLPRVPLLGPAPAPEAETVLTVKANDIQRPLPSSQASPVQTSPAGDVTMSDDSDDEEEETFSKIDMDALKQRGKGSYYCPLGHRCDKGGVDKSGNLVLFDRNSSFAQHCNKHRKPWRCEVPGCPNPPKKRRFARRDGLERHKATVKHRVGS